MKFLATSFFTILLMSIFPLLALDSKMITYCFKPISQGILACAAWNNDIKKIQKLLALGANPNASHSAGITPLMIAAYKRYTVLAKLLLEHKAQVNAVTQEKFFDVGRLILPAKSGVTPLMLAAYSGNLELLLILLKAGAQANATDNFGQSALTYAILAQPNWPHEPLSPSRKKALQLLLDFGANGHICDCNGLDPLYYYSCIAGLKPGFNDQYENDPYLAQQDPLYRQMIEKV